MILWMASSQPVKGRGRGRTTKSTIDQVPQPSITAFSATNDFTTSADNSSSILQSTACTNAGRGRGRGRDRILQQPQNEVVTANLPQTISPLVDDIRKMSIRSVKPVEGGTIGEEIRVMVNYFPVLQYPQQGLVYEYHIEIRNSRDIMLNRYRRR